MAFMLTMGPLEVDLEKLVELVRKLVSVQLDDEARKSILELIKEITKVYDNIVDSLTPFYKMIDDATFKKDFAAQYSEFKALFLKRIGESEFHCTNVQNQLDRLSSKKSWLNKLPLLRRNLQRFNYSKDAWYMQDSNYYLAMDKFHKGLVTELDGIYKSVDNKSPARLRKDLGMFLSKCDDDFLKIKRLMDELLIISRKL